MNNLRTATEAALRELDSCSNASFLLNGSSELDDCVGRACDLLAEALESKEAS